MPFVPYAVCVKRYATWYIGVPPSHICAGQGTDPRRADTCSGDSGGPILIGMGANAVLVGVTSFGEGRGNFEPAGGALAARDHAAPLQPQLTMPPPPPSPGPSFACGTSATLNLGAYTSITAMRAWLKEKGGV